MLGSFINCVNSFLSPGFFFHSLEVNLDIIVCFRSLPLLPKPYIWLNNNRIGILSVSICFKWSTRACLKLLLILLLLLLLLLLIELTAPYPARSPELLLSYWQTWFCFTWNPWKKEVKKRPIGRKESTAKSVGKWMMMNTSITKLPHLRTKF